jgi:hypothetical protein
VSPVIPAVPFPCAIALIVDSIVTTSNIVFNLIFHDLNKLNCSYFPVASGFKNNIMWKQLLFNMLSLCGVV